jgi:hypothetical protein
MTSINKLKIWFKISLTPRKITLSQFYLTVSAN